MDHCSKCRRPRNRPGQRYCQSCHTKYIKAWRINSALVRFKDSARAAVRYALKTGRLKRLSCEHINPETRRRCGAWAEAHHPDYSKPLDVIWLCVPHHGAEHKRIREIKNGEPLQATG